MKIPHPRTIAYRVVRYLFEHQKATQATLTEEIGATYSRENIVKAIRALRIDGAIIAPTGRRVMPNAELALSEDMRALLDDEAEINEVYRGEIVPHAERNVFGATISKKNIPSCLGMREGSNEYLSWPSKHV